mgnify:FL=1
MFEESLDYLDMKREMAMSAKLDEMGYDVAPKNANCVLTSQPSAIEDSLYLGASAFSKSSILIPKVAEDVSMDIENSAIQPQPAENKTPLLVN